MHPVDRKEIWDRAASRCEYCQMPQEYDVLPFQLDHIRAQKHRGPFAWNGPHLTGFTPIGRATIEVLKINSWERVEHRRLLILASVFPHELD